MNKRAERKGKIQLIDASSICHKLRKAVGMKKNEFTPKDRKKITELYTNFEENEYCKIFDNEEFIYREYSVMQPLQRSYAITDERIESMLVSGSLSNLYDELKVLNLENPKEPLSSNDKKKLEEYRNNKPLYDRIIETLNNNISEEIYFSIDDFNILLSKILPDVDKKILKKIANGLSIMDKKAEIVRDKKGQIIYDKESKDIELVKYKESIGDYMSREVLPHVPDAQAFFEEDLTAKNPKIKTGAEIPFTRYFYKYQTHETPEELEKQFKNIESEIDDKIKTLFD